MERILDWNKYLDTAAKMVSEGIVMLKNENNALPLDADKEVAVFGRIQFHYYKSGTGSGGMVNVTKVVNILDGLIDNGVKVNEKLLDTYRKWDRENPFDLGEGWGGEPWSQKEMPLDEGLVKETAKSCETAIVIIGRTAGEEQDNRLEAGSYLLSDDEIEMLTVVRKHFKKVVLLLNVGNIIDMTDINRIAPDSVLYVWQGGMTGGKGTADVLTGKVSPSGKLPDTIAYKASDYPSDANFGREENRDIYAEDIYVGYRYYDTSKVRVQYPFGFGLSYTEFTYSDLIIEEDGIKVSVTNTGDRDGAEVVQMYVGLPNAIVFRPEKELKGFVKVYLKAGESRQLRIPFDDKTFRYWNIKTGQWEIETGTYQIMVGASVADIRLTGMTERTGNSKGYPYNPAKMPYYYTGIVQKISDEEFRELLGHEIPNGRWSGNLGINDAICQMYYAKSRLARLIYRYLTKMKKKSEAQGKPDLNILFIYNMPFRGIAKMTGGAVSMEMVYGIVDAVNGHFMLGVKKVVGGYFRNRRNNKKYEKLLKEAGGKCR